MGWFGRLLGREARAAAHPRDPALAEMLGLPNTAANIAVTPRLALRCPAVYAPIRLLTGTVSVLPLELFLRTGDGAREKASASPLYDLVHAKPNDWQTSAQFRRTMTGWLLGWGNSYARIRQPGAPTALEPMHPDRTWPYRDSAGRIWYRHTPRNGPQLTLAAEEVLHLRYGPDRDDEGLEAESPILLNRETIALAMAATEYLGKFFANYAVPKGVLEVPGVLKPEAKKVLRESWEQRQAGLENAHRMAVLDGGMSFKSISMTNEQAQFLELYRQVSSEVSTKVFGVPPHMSGDVEKASSWGTGIEQMNIGYVVHVVQPILEEWEQSLDCALLTPGTRRRMFFEYNVDALLRGDFKSRMEGYALQIQWGLVAPNEIRKLMNLPPLPGGDERLQPLNMAPASRIMDVLLKQPAQAQRALKLLRGGGAEEASGLRKARAGGVV